MLIPRNWLEGENSIRGVVLLNVSPSSTVLKAFKEAIPESVKVIHFEDVLAAHSPSF